MCRYFSVHFTVLHQFKQVLNLKLPNKSSIIKKLQYFIILMFMKSLLIFNCKPFHIISNHMHFEVSMDAIVSCIPRCINNTANQFILISMNYLNGGFLCSSQKLHSINSHRFSKLFPYCAVTVHRNNAIDFTMFYFPR